MVRRGRGKEEREKGTLSLFFHTATEREKDEERLFQTEPNPREKEGKGS